MANPSLTCFQMSRTKMNQLRFIKTKIVVIIIVKIIHEEMTAFQCILFVAVNAGRYRSRCV